MPRDGFGGNFSDRNRDGVDDEFDRQPGNPGVSREYALKYDRRSEQEFTNRLETANQIEEARIISEIEQRRFSVRDLLRGAQKQVNFFPSVGKFIIPKENTWAAHAELIKSDECSLCFNPEKYVYFDKIIAEKLGVPALTDPNHPDHAKYEGLRTNLAVMRNDIIGMYLDDGAFDPGDEKYIPKIVGVAKALGDALANDKWYKRPFTRSISVDVANVEGVGAREMYKYLLDNQAAALPPALQPINNLISDWFGLPDRHWELKPLGETPFSDENLAAPPPGSKEAAPTQPVGTNLSAHVAGISLDAAEMALKLRSPESLEPPTREASVEEARTILRWLKNLKFTEQEVEEFIAQGTPVEQAAKAEAIARLIEIYAGQLALATRRDPPMPVHPMGDANDAAGAMAQSLLQYGLKLLPDGHPTEDPLKKAVAASPPEWDSRETQSVARLLETLELGIESASGVNISGISRTQRLLDISNRMEKTARKLRSPDTLELPLREESIELAREILRRFKELGFSDKPLEEALTAGRPEDGTALVRQLETLANTYLDMLAEAAQINPNILQDPQIKEASNAAGHFAHTIKLMAAKEMPNSLAAAQQISADIAQMPEEWKQLHDRTVGRLIASMEGGLEKAFGAIETAQQEQQQQDEELAQQQQAVEQAAQNGRRRRKRRRRSGGSSSTPALTKSAKRRNTNDLNGDGVMDKLQGLNLKGDDMIAIRDLGSSLRGISKQVDDLPPMANVTLNEPIAPDDKTFAVRERDGRIIPPNQQNKRPRI